MELQARDRKRLRTIWHVPLITLILLIVLGIMTADGLREEHLQIALLLILLVVCFSIAGFVRLIKCAILYRRTELSGKARYLVLGLVLNAIIISIPFLLFLQDHLYSKGIERHNNACSEILNIQRELEYFRLEHKGWPSEEQGLEELHRNSIGPPISFSLIDPWGKPYRYRLEKSSERKDGFIPYVWSSGPDGVSGTDDDVDDKTPRQMKHVNHWPAA